MAPGTFERLQGIVARYLDIPPEGIGEDSRLEDLGVDSLGALELVFEIEEEFKISIPDERVAEFTSMRAACQVVDALQKTTAVAP